MVARFIVLFLILPLPLCAQDEDRKPSPFPEKNRAREAAAKKRSRSKGTASADRADGNTGQACFFSPKPGRATPDDLVAAHATYDLGARVQVTNLGNGKTVEVTIIDRLPDARRIISVSEAAARKLGFYEAGVANVKLEVLQADAAPGKRP